VATDTKEDRLDLIRKLLAKAESTTHPEEAKTFTAKAEELMVRWSIEDADVAAATAGMQDDIGKTVVLIPANEYRHPKIHLLNVIAIANSCRLVTSRQRYRCTECGEWLLGRSPKQGLYHRTMDHSHKPKGDRVMELFIAGFATDRQFVELLFTSLLVQREHEFELPGVADKMWEEFAWRDGRPNARGGFRIKYHNTFSMGYADEVGRRLLAAKKSVEAGVAAETGRTSESVALVLADRAARVDSAMFDLFGALGRGAGSSAGRGSGNAYSSGREAGGRADVSGKSHSRKALS
jgi:hypothetical protein